MLVISRRKGQRIKIGPDIEIIVTEVHRSNCKIAVRAPANLVVLRGEVFDEQLTKEFFTKPLEKP